MSIDDRENAPTTTGREPLAPLARKPLTVVAAVLAAPLLLLLGRYGYDADELYFVAAGRHPDWGYADQPPFVPMVARLMDSAFPGSVYALRLPSLAVVVAGVFLIGLLAREMGGRTRAQVVAAVAYAITFSSFGLLLQTDSFSAVFWLLIAWLVARWVRAHHDGERGSAVDRTLLWAGIATAVAIQEKYLVPVEWVGIVVGVLVSGPRAMLRRPMLYAGAAVAVASAVPGFVWQATNGWPQLKFAGLVREQNEAVLGGRLWFLPNAMLMAGVVVGVVLFGYGLWQLMRSARLREFRFLGWAALVVTAVFLAAGGRFTYVAGVFPMVFAAGAVQMELGAPRRWWRWLVSPPVFALSVLLALPPLPLLPRSSIEATAAKVAAGEEISEDDVEGQLATGWTDWSQQVAWPVMVDSVAATYRSLPADVRRSTIVLADDYSTAAALELLGPARGLTAEVYSYSVGYGYLKTPPAESSTVLFVGHNDDLAELFGEVTPLGVVQGPAADLAGVPVVLCAAPVAPLDEIWSEMRYP